MKFSIRNESWRLAEAVPNLPPPQARLSTASKLVAVAILWLAPLAMSLHAASGINRNPGWPGNTHSGVACFGKIKVYGRGYGPYDYVTERSKAGIVEAYHFTPKVEQLIRGESGSIEGDLYYTLRAFPNHHRALWAMSRYYLRKGRQAGFDELARLERGREGTPPPECFFQRAKRFAPQDGTVSAIFGIYLHRRRELDAALAEYRIAEAKDPENAELIYNMGLLFLDMNDLALAKQYAERAASLGYPLTGLRKKVQDRESELPSGDAQ